MMHLFICLYVMCLNDGLLFISSFRLEHRQTRHPCITMFLFLLPLFLLLLFSLFSSTFMAHCFELLFLFFFHSFPLFPTYSFVFRYLVKESFGLILLCFFFFLFFLFFPPSSSSSRRESQRTDKTKKHRENCDTAKYNKFTELKLYTNIQIHI